MKIILTLILLFSTSIVFADGGGFTGTKLPNKETHKMVEKGDRVFHGISGGATGT